MPDPETTPQAPEETSAPEAVASAGDTKPEASAGSKQTGKQTTGKENQIPQRRFNEVIVERDTYKEEAEALRGQIESIQEERSKLIDLMAQQKDDVNLVSNLRSLAVSTEDQSVKDAIDLLDARMRGENAEVEKVVGEKVAEGAFTEAQARKIVAEQTAKLQDNIDEQKAELLFNQANTKAERMLSGLPEEYTDKDKEVISEAWLRRVDWDGMERDVGEMDDLLTASLQKTLDWYGEPRGVLKVSETEELTEDGEPVERPPTPEEEIAMLKEINWGELDKDGKPVYSEEDFSKAAVRTAQLANRQ
jgi:hypothetical protein